MQILPVLRLEESCCKKVQFFLNESILVWSKNTESYHKHRMEALPTRCPHMRLGLGEISRWRGRCMWSESNGEGGRDHSPVSSERLRVCTHSGVAAAVVSSPEESSREVSAGFLVAQPLCLILWPSWRYCKPVNVFNKFLFCSSGQSSFPCFQLQILTDTQTKWIEHKVQK